MAGNNELTQILADNIPARSVALDGRSIDELLRLFRQYCSSIPFLQTGDKAWDNFYFSSNEHLTELGKLFRNELKANGSLAPQLAFLMVFYRMLETPRALLNCIPSMHKQMYYQDLLRLSPRTAKSDEVIVGFVLNDDTSELQIPVNTFLDAGTDVAGHPLRYSTQNELLANQCQWTDLRWTTADEYSAPGISSRTVFDESANLEWPESGLRLFSNTKEQSILVVRGILAGSPVLKMSSGCRKVTLTFDRAIDPALTEKALVTTTNRWLSLILASPTGTAIASIEYTLQIDEPVSSPADLDELPEDMPFIKVLYTGVDELPRITSIHVQVENMTDISYASVDGIEQINTRSYPFGNTPVIGANFSLVSPDWYGKDGIDLAVTIEPEWVDLPATGFPDWYTNYPGKPANNNAFTVQAWISRGSERSKLGDMPLTLFADGTSTPVGNILNLNAFQGLAGRPTENQDPREWPAWLSIELNTKDFLHREYQQEVSLAGNLNIPYTPQLSSLSVGWSASAQPVHYYHLTPFGFTVPENVTNELTEAIYLGVARITPGKNLSLYWNLRASQALNISWQYLSKEKGWAVLDASVEDGSLGLSDSGLWTVILPDDATDHNTEMPAGRYWIRALRKPDTADTTAGTPSGPWMYGLLTNAVVAKLEQADLVDVSHFNAPLPAGTIFRTATALDGLSEVIQPWASSKGLLPETEIQFNQRIANHITTRKRVLTWSDMSMQLQEHFPEIYSVFTPSAEAISLLPPPGQQVIVVVPGIQTSDNDDPIRPVFNDVRLKKMQDYLQSIASLWFDIVVYNPKYRDVKIHYNVEFTAGINPDYGYRKLKDEISGQFMPWTVNTLSGAKPGNQFDYYGVVAWIQQRPYVSRVIELTLDNGKASLKGDDTEVLILVWDSEDTVREGR